MLEIEIKARLDDRQRLLAALEREGFAHTRTLEETDVYFNGVDRSFKETDEALRLRYTLDLATSARTAALTYKGPKLDRVSQTRTEHEVGLLDGQGMKLLLTKLGHTPVLTVKKRRAYFEKGSVTATVDEVEGLGHYMELETLAEDEALREEAVEALFDLLATLGIPRETCTRYSYLEMLLESEVRG